ncbi:MAG: peptidoglycan bridge formation glycyltransferase FemA/FemB family protein [Nitrospirae bacterium]|nr:peptidoglycan bridge formation glycyltransferase FemA/FemB family protein [Nitrospirota bacterium]
MLDIINPITYPHWDELLLANKSSSFFHSSNWAKVLYESYGYKPLYFSLIDNGILKVLHPFMEVKSILTGKRGVSLPFTDYCEPIISNDLSPQDVFDSIKEYAEKAGWKYIEIRGNRSFFNGNPSSSYYYGHTLDLSNGAENIFSNLRESTRRNIKKSEREGIKATISTSYESVSEFYRLNCMTRKEHGLPPQPFRFFQNIYEHIISKNHGVIVLANHSQKNIAGAVYFHLGKKAIYKYGASERRCQRLRPNNLVMWEALRHYSQNGYQNFCFGRTEPENSGLRQFKLGWGASENVIKYFRYSVNKKRFIESNSSNDTGLHTGIFRAMPIPLSRAIGKALYKHMG